MMVEQAPEWSPSSEEDKRVKEAFHVLNASMDKVVLQTPDGKPKPSRFILQSKAVFDLRAYVLTGKSFPNTVNDFEAKMSRRDLRKLADIDNTIYDETRDIMMTVRSACAEFHDNHMTKLITLASTAANYSGQSVELLEEAEEINLKKQLSILLDPKYKSQADWNMEYREAIEAASMNLHVLKEQGEEKEREVKNVLETLIRFKTDTSSNLAGVQYLTKQYETGPVENTSQQKTPYLQYLNTDFNEATSKVQDLVKEYNAGFDDKTEATGIGIVFLGPIGWIVMGVKAAKAESLRNAHENLERQAEKLKEENRAQLDFITYVKQLVTQFDGIDDKMNIAITATKTLGELFKDQAACYDRIGSYLGGMKGGADAKELADRKAFIEYNVSQAIQKLRELKIVAYEFQRSMVNEIRI